MPSWYSGKLVKPSPSGSSLGPLPDAPGEPKYWASQASGRPLWFSSVVMTSKEAVWPTCSVVSATESQALLEARAMLTLLLQTPLTKEVRLLGNTRRLVWANSATVMESNQEVPPSVFCTTM